MRCESERKTEGERVRIDKYASTNFVHYDTSSKSHCRFFNLGKKKKKIVYIL